MKLNICSQFMMPFIINLTGILPNAATNNGMPTALSVPLQNPHEAYYYSQTGGRKEKTNAENNTLLKRVFLSRKFVFLVQLSPQINFVLKQLFLFTLSIFLYTVTAAQVYKFVYFLDKDFVSVNKASAFFIGKGLKENGLFLLDCFEKETNRLFLKAYFKDSSLTVLHGPFKKFNSTGAVAEEGMYSEGLEEGLWVLKNKEGLVSDSLIYFGGKKTEATSFMYYPSGKLYTRSETDSSGRTISYTAYTESGMTLDDDKVFTKVETEAEYPGGREAYKLFMQKNLNALVAVNNRAPSGLYTVIVRFIIDKDGSISNITPETNHGYGMEQEVVRVIRSGPKWKPAMQNGHVVKAYRRQPVSFVVQQ